MQKILPLRCSMCGAELKKSKSTVLTCEYCGTQQIITSFADKTTDREAEIARLTKRVNILLSDFHWKKVDQVCEKILALDPENTFAYLGKLLADKEVCSMEELAETCMFTFYGDPNYKHIMEFGTPKLKETLRHINEEIKPRELKFRYRSAVQDMKDADNEKRAAETDVLYMKDNHERAAERLYTSAAEDFLALKKYENAKDLYVECVRNGNLQENKLFPSTWSLFWKGI